MRTLMALTCFALCGAGGCGGGGGGDSDGGGVGGTGTAAGTLDGRAFDQVGAAYLLGMPDDPARTIVVHVFDVPVACADIEAAGWDERLPASTQALEIKLIGQESGAYPVASDGRPGAHEADVNYTLTSSTPTEVSATGGNVTLDALDGSSGAAGTFDLTFAAGSVTGAFSAVGCAGGREP